jgi:hypothetical protein
LPAYSRWDLRRFTERITLTELVLAIAAVGVVYLLSLLFLCFDDTERGEMKRLWGKFYSQVRPFKCRSELRK